MQSDGQSGNAATARRILKVRETTTVDEMRQLVEDWLNRVPAEQKSSWWMEGRAALYRLAALAAVAAEHGIPIHGLYPGAERG